MAKDRRRWWHYPVRAVIGLVLLIVVWLVAASIVYSPQYVVRVLAWGESDFGDYIDHFDHRELTASQQPFRFGSAPDEALVRAALVDAFGVGDVERFLEENETQAFIVIRNDQVLYEHYFNGTERDSMLTSYSTAKSFVSTLVGIAIDEGHIGAVTDPITDYLPELEERDERFALITIENLLDMAAGLGYQEMRWALFNGDDPLVTYHTDQRQLALENTRIIDPPGQYFFYNKYHPQLLGLILERATGVSVTEYTQTRLWDPLGMEFDGEWSLDREGGFEKMEAGLNARAIDYAKLGRLYLHDGEWEGDQIVSAEWVAACTTLNPTRDRSDYYPNEFGQGLYHGGIGFYNRMWYGRLRDGERADFFAAGDHGQFIFVSPANDLIIVRNGTSYGESPTMWIDAFYAAADRLGERS